MADVEGNSPEGGDRTLKLIGNDGIDLFRQTILPLRSYVQVLRAISATLIPK